MSRILIGSSNIRRFYPCEQTNEYPKYKVESATLKRAFEVSVEAVPNDARVIISVLENFIEKVTNINDTSQKLKEMQQVIQSVVDTVVEVAKQKREARFVMAYPILRPGNKWMTENEDSIRKEFEKSINSQSEINISKIDSVSRASQVFENDGVHLTAVAGRNFLGNLIGMAEESFLADLVDIEREEEDEEEDTIGKVINLGKTSSHANSKVDLVDLKRVTTDLKNWRSNVERSLNSRFRSDNLMFARLRDEIDSETNRKREDRTLVTGFVDPTKLPKITAERNEALKTIAKEFCQNLKDDFDGTIMFATTSGRLDKGNLMLEFRIDDVEKAREIRKIFATRRAAGNMPEGFENVQVMTAITLATKVRIEIMKTIARRIESSTETAYVPTFLPRPIMHIKAKSDRSESGTRGKHDPRRHIGSLTFADSIMQYGGLISGNDLEPAYKKAAGNFRGQMRQHFVVLEDSDYRPRYSYPPPAVGSGTSGSGGSSGTSGTSGPTGPSGSSGAGGPSGLGGSRTSRGTKRGNEDDSAETNVERSKRIQTKI
jgi:uncharacterized membrane protein YgcG